jgi:hypothetical protein
VDEADLRVRGDIERYGWHVAKIAGDESAPPWAFSIGLEQNFEHPEVLVCGMELDLLHGLINQVGDHIKRGAHFDESVRPEGILEKHPPAFRPVLERWHGAFVGNAAWFYRDRPFRVVQCFWPDTEGLLPWESGFSPAWAGRQPLLYLEDEESALGRSLAAVLRQEGAL